MKQMGGLHVGQFIESAAALICLVNTRLQGRDTKIKDFLPARQEVSVVDTDEAFVAAFMGMS